VRGGAQDNDVQAGKGKVKTQTVVQILVKAVDIGSVSVQVCLISPQGSPLGAMGVYVETDQSGGKVPYSDNRMNSDIPTAYMARWRYGPSAPAPVGTCQYQRHRLKAQLVLAQL